MNTFLNSLSEENNKEFVHLHCHDYYSFLDGYGTPIARAKKAKELGMTAMATTNHNHLGGCLEFQRACNEEGIKPLLGVELYYTDDTKILSLDAKERFKIAIDKAKENGIEIPAKATQKAIKELVENYAYPTKQYHILFIAKNQIGWRNLTKLESTAAKECTYNGRFICDNKMIKKYKDGIIMTTACLGSIVNNYLMKNEINKAYSILDEWREIFEEDFYIEIQPLNEPEQAICNMHLFKYAKDNGVKVVATNDVHYTNEEDIDDHDTLLCIGIGKLKSDEERMKYKPEFWVRSYAEMIDAFNNQFDSNEEIFKGFEITKNEYIQLCIAAIEETCNVANKIDSDIKLGEDKPILPKTKIPNGHTSEEYLSLLAYKGLFKYLKKNPKLDMREYLDRLHFELSVINGKGFADYMLIVRDLVNWCQENNIPTGPGRGSASGSLVLFSTGITKCIDPIKYGLLFSRFLTMDRTALPDIDTDFSYLNRQRVIQYLKDTYGEECVSFIGTYTELGVKNGLKDVGRVLDIDFSIMNSITKKIDEITGEAPSIKFKNLDALKEGDKADKSNYEEFKKLESKYAELFRLARAFEGTKRNFGVHASGVLVTPMPITNVFPTRSVDGSLVTLYTGPQVEECMGVKLDILGLKTLDVLDLTIKAVDPNANVYQLYDEVDKYLDNEEMFAALCRKETEGIFQLESNLFKGLVSDMLPEKLDDITLITSYGRPGPLSAKLNVEYAKRKKGESEITEPLPNTWDIVEDSLGVLAYQEHCMRIAQRVAKFDDNQADSFLRKAQAKKKRYLLDLCNQWFIYGKINKEAPKGYDYENKSQPYYDPTAKYGAPILGGINNGYKEQELIDYTVMIDGFCSYLFNKSHACSYSFISVCTMYLKTFFKTEFFAALLTMQAGKQEKIDLYCNVANQYGIEICVPDINLSNSNFTAIEGKILYGLESIKGVGATAIPEIIANRPYKTIADVYEKAGKKAFNKRTGEALIKAGAFDFLFNNRNVLLNNFQNIRKAKKEEQYDVFKYNKLLCMEYEESVLGSSITFKPFWSTISNGEIVSVTLKDFTVREKSDKRGNMMGFLTGTIEDSTVKGIVFSSIYCKNIAAFDTRLTNQVYLKVQKDDRGGFVVKSILADVPVNNVKEVTFDTEMIDLINEEFEKISA